VTHTDYFIREQQEKTSKLGY